MIRFDTRDTGRSTGFPVGAPPYNGNDLVLDVLGLLDSYGVASAHLVGLSQGAGIAQSAALDHPERVASLTLASFTSGDPDLPPMAPELRDFFSGALPQPSWTDRAAVIDYLVESERPFSPYFDEDAARALAEATFDRTTHLASQITNPFLLDSDDPWQNRLSTLKTPTLVLHGTDDPLFPLPHGQALAAQIPNSRFIALPRMGHETFPPHTWPIVIPAILSHTN